MGLFDKFKKKGIFCEPTVPEEEKKYYQPDSYYTEYSHKGTQFEERVIPFDERKKISYPSKNGLFVAEILLLEYCSYGTYPHPKTGYPGFWWFAYGIRDVGAALKSLEDRGYIRFSTAIDTIPCMTVAELKEIAGELGIPVSGNKPDVIAAIVDNASESEIERVITERKYELTEKGFFELQENAYVPYMHKHKKKTTEDTTFGSEFNVWSVNRAIGNGDKRDWREIALEQEQALGY